MTFLKHSFLIAAYLDKAREVNVRKQEVRHDVKKCQQRKSSGFVLLFAEKRYVFLVK